MMTYEYDAERSIIHLHASGILMVDDPIQYFYRLRDDDRIHPPCEEHVYFTHLDDISFSYKDVVSIREAYLESGHGTRLSSVKFITDSDLSYGMARMVTQIFGEVFQHVEIERR